MTTSEFIKVKMTGKKPQFKELIGLSESGETSKLIDFMTMLHPNQCKQAQGSKGEVFGNSHYVFTIYKTAIVRTDVQSGNKLLFKL